MLIKIDGNEIVDANITVVSLVKRGANRAPFKIVKNVAGSGHLGPEAQPDYNRPGPAAPASHRGGPYAENNAGPAELEALVRGRRTPVSDRYGAQESQTSERERNPLNLVRKHGLDDLILDAHRRKHGGW